MVKRKKNRRPPPKDFHSDKDLGFGCGNWPYKRVLDVLKKKWNGRTKGYDVCRIPNPTESLKNEICDNLKNDMIEDRGWPISVRIDLSRMDGIWIFFEGGGRQIKSEYLKTLREIRDAEHQAKQIFENEQRMSQLIARLTEWEENKGLPSALWLEVSPDQYHKLQNRQRANTVEQVYVLELNEIGEYYVGRTGIGFPYRCYQHGYNESNRRTKYEHLRYKDEHYEKGIVLPVINILNPIDKKFSCTHWLEWWLQNQMLELGFDLPYGKETSPIHRENIGGGPPQVCDKCLKICKKLSEDFDERMFEKFLI